MKRSPEQMALEATVRTSTGKEAAGVLRREGMVPGVVYGEGKETIPIQVKAGDLTRILQTKAGGNVLIALHLKPPSPDLTGPSDPPGNRTKTEGAPSLPQATGEMNEGAVLIKELQHHPVWYQITHVDFQRVSLTRRITVTVPLTFKGEAIGVRQEGGLLEHLRWDLEVECLPTEIPSEVPVDISDLKLGQVWDAQSVHLPEGVRLVTAPELPVVACVTPKEEVAAPTAAEAVTGMMEPEVIKQKKPEEIAAEEAAGAKEKAK
jgi:large subunit ribosomal protein L25